MKRVLLQKIAAFLKKEQVMTGQEKCDKLSEKKLR
jgi:hypothetical protein